ncbi:MAG: hypothetical protein ACREBR_02205 [bacterium]
METSEFTETSTSAIHDFLTTLLHGHDPSKQLSTLSQLQAIQPVGKGGLGLRSTQDSRMGRFLIPTIKSIRQTLDDIPLPAAPTDDDHPPLSIILPDSLKNVFQPWQTTNVKLVAVVDSIQDKIQHLPQLQNVPRDDLINYLTLEASLGSLAKTIYRSLLNSRLQAVIPSLPVEDQIALPSLQNHLATVPLAHMTRRLTTNRFSQLILEL